MKTTNIFAGGRRLAWIGAGAIVLYASSKVLEAPRTVPHTVLVSDNGVGTPWSDGCTAGWADTTVIVASSSGSLPLQLCAPDRNRLRALAPRAEFLESWEQLALIETQRDPSVSLLRRLYAGYGLAALVAYGLAVWLFGWVVRGFLGIPRGMDHWPAGPPISDGDGVQ